MINSQVIFAAIWIIETVDDLSDCSRGERRNDRHVSYFQRWIDIDVLCSSLQRRGMMLTSLLCLMRAATVHVFISWCLTLESNMVTLCTPSWTFKKSAFCPHSSVCFVWISVIMSLCSIHWLVFMNETKCVYCAARNEYLNIILYHGLDGLSPASHRGKPGSILGQSL